MGRQHRVNERALWAGLCVAIGTAAIGCNGEAAQRAEARRALLSEENLMAKRDERIAAQRITNAEGDLLPSTNQIAGVVLPRGFSPKFTFDHEWYYDGEHSFGRVRKYFEQQLDGTLERPDTSSLVFARATTKGAKDMKPVSVKIYPVPGRDDWCRIQINAPKPLPEHFPTADEINQELARRRENQN
jgi:hypothetical protein